MQHLAVEPVELVPVEAGAGFVNTIKVEDPGRFFQAEAFAHALGGRPAQQGHVVDQGGLGITQLLEVADGGHPVPFGQFFALLVEDQGRVGELGGGFAQRLVQQQLLGRIGDVILAANHMADRHEGVIHHHH